MSLFARRNRRREAEEHHEAEIARLRLAAFSENERATALDLVDSIQAKVSALNKVLVSGADTGQTAT